MILTRYCYGEICTLGRLQLADGDRILHTLERPWLAGLPGGMPFVSCIPDARYKLIEHVRPNGDRVLALRNPGAGVYYSQRSIPESGGRYLILLHAANWVDELHGCIAPGLGKTVSENRSMVTSSRAAMGLIMKSFAKGDTTLTIKAYEGAKQ